MKSFDTDLKKYAHKTRLSAAERADLRERVVAYMEYHPFPRTIEVTAEKKAPASLPLISISKNIFARVSTVTFNTLHTRVAVSVFALVLIVTVPFAAEKAAPGDVLYLVKTKVNEPVLGQFNSSPYEKVAFETTLMERRIAEARLLAKEGKLSEETEAALAQSIQGHANAAQEGINTLKESDAESAAIAEITFGSVLDVQTAVLDSTMTLATERSTDTIVGAVREAKSAIDAQRGTTTPSYERLMAHVEQETTRAHELWSSISNSATAEEKEQIESRLSDLERRIASAHEAHTNFAHVEEESDTAVDPALMTMSTKVAPTNGVSELGATLGDLKKLILFMTDIDVRNTVTLESLVPVTRTSEEEVYMQLDDVKARREMIGEELEKGERQEVATSTEAQLQELDILLETGNAARAEGDTEMVENILPQMHLLVGNIEFLLTQPEIEGAATSTIGGDVAIPVEPLEI